MPVSHAVVGRGPRRLSTAWARMAGGCRMPDTRSRVEHLAIGGRDEGRQLAVFDATIVVDVRPPRRPEITSCVKTPD